MPRDINSTWFTIEENTYLRVRVNCCSFDFTKSPTLKVVQPRKLRYKTKQKEKITSLLIFEVLIVTSFGLTLGNLSFVPRKIFHSNILV